jgi:hypothetical protein
MPDLAAIILAANTFTTYPAFGDALSIGPKAVANEPRIERVSDNGLILEMIVTCPKGIAVISYSKVERLYCSPKQACGRDLSSILQRSCNARN